MCPTGGLSEVTERVAALLKVLPKALEGNDRRAGQVSLIAKLPRALTPQFPRRNADPTIIIWHCMMTIAGED